jgi:tetratricopeptide (TPR) repeat protein
LLRQFAADKLATRTTAVERAFVDYFYQFARRHQEDYDGLRPEWRNVLAAVAKAHGLAAWQLVLDSVQVLDEPWFRQIRFNDMRAGLALALDAATALHDQPALARTLLRSGEIEMELNGYAAAEAHLAEATRHFTRLEDSLVIAHAKFLLGRIRTERAQNDQALVLFEESRRIFDEQHDVLGVAKNLNLIAVCTIKMHRDFQTAHAYLEQSATLQRSVSWSATYVETLRYLARVKIVLHAYEEGQQLLAEAAAVSRRLRDIGEYAAVLYERVLLCKIRQQFDEALLFGYECLDNFRQLGSLRWEALIKTQLGLLHQAKEEYHQAAALLNEGLQIWLMSV